MHNYHRHENDRVCNAWCVLSIEFLLYNSFVAQFSIFIIRCNEWRSLTQIYFGLHPNHLGVPQPQNTRSLRGLLDKFGSSFVFFIGEKVIFTFRLITWQKIMNLRAQELPKSRGYTFIIGIHRLFTLSKLWGHSYQLLVLPKLGLLKRTELSQVYATEITRISKYSWKDREQKLSCRFLIFTTVFFCNGDLKSKNGKKITVLTFFLLEGLWKNNSDLISRKKQSWVCLPYVFSFTMIGESYLYYENSVTSIILSRMGKSWFFPEKKDAKIMRKK